MAFHKYKDGKGWYYRGYNPVSGEFYTQTDRKHRKQIEARKKAAKKREKARKAEEDWNHTKGCLYAIGILLAVSLIVTMVQGLVVGIIDGVSGLIAEYGLVNLIFYGECIIAVVTFVCGMIWLIREEHRK